MQPRRFCNLLRTLRQIVKCIVLGSDVRNLYNNLRESWIHLGDMIDG